MMLSATVRKRLSSLVSIDAVLNVDPGVTILFGESGAGKTTILRCLAGLDAPDSGCIVLDGRTLFDASRGCDVPAPARQIGYVFQQLALFPHLSVEANIGYGLNRLDTSSRQRRIGAMAESFRITHLLHRLPKTISGGERQRVALARALVTDPRLLMLDEPLSALDYATQSKIIGDLRQWNAERRIPILYVTHSHREVFALGERVLVIDHGRIVADGTPDAVLSAPALESIAQIAGYENLFDVTVIAPHRDSGTMECRVAGGVEIEVPLFAAEVGAVITLALRAGDILIATAEPRGLSARNILPGTIRSLERSGSTVIAMVEAGRTFEVHITPGAAQMLALAPGMGVWLVIKTHSFRRITRDAGRLSD